VTAFPVFSPCQRWGSSEPGGATRRAPHLGEGQGGDFLLGAGVGPRCPVSCGAEGTG